MASIFSSLLQQLKTSVASASRGATAATAAGPPPLTFSNDMSAIDKAGLACSIVKLQDDTLKVLPYRLSLIHI